MSMWDVKKASHKKLMKCVTTLTVYKMEHNSTAWSTKGTMRVSVYAAVSSLIDSPVRV